MAFVVRRLFSSSALARTKVATPAPISQMTLLETAELQQLAQKARGPWKQLSKEEFVQCKEVMLVWKFLCVFQLLFFQRFCFLINTHHTSCQLPWSVLALFPSRPKAMGMHWICLCSPPPKDPTIIRKPNLIGVPHGFLWDSGCNLEPTIWLVDHMPMAPHYWRGCSYYSFLHTYIAQSKGIHDQWLNQEVLLKYSVVIVKA